MLRRPFFTALVLLVPALLAGCTNSVDTTTDSGDAHSVTSTPATWAVGSTFTYRLREDANATRVLLVHASGERIPGEAWWLVAVADIDAGSIVRGRDVLIRHARLETASVASTLTGAPPAIADTYKPVLRVGDSWTLPLGNGVASYAVKDAGAVMTPNGERRGVVVEKTEASAGFLARTTFAQGWDVPVAMEEGLTDGGTVTWVLESRTVAPVNEILKITPLDGPFGGEVITVRYRGVTGWSQPSESVRYTRGDDHVNASLKPRLKGALDWLRDSTSPESTVAVWWDDGAAVEGYAGRRVLAIGPSEQLSGAIPRPRWIDANALPTSAPAAMNVLADILLEPPATAATLMLATGLRYLVVDDALVPVDDPRTPNIDLVGLLDEITTAAGTDPGRFVRAQLRADGTWHDATEPGPAEAVRLLYKPAFFNTTLYRVYGGPVPTGSEERDGAFWESVLARPRPGWDSGGRMRLAYVDAGVRIMEASYGVLLRVNVTLGGAPVQNAYAEVWDDAGDILVGMIPIEQRARADPRAYDVRQNSALTNETGVLSIIVPWSGERGLTVRFPEFTSPNFADEFTIVVSPEAARRGDVVHIDYDLAA